MVFQGTSGSLSLLSSSSPLSCSTVKNSLGSAVVFFFPRWILKGLGLTLLGSSCLAMELSELLNVDTEKLMVNRFAFPTGHEGRRKPPVADRRKCDMQCVAAPDLVVSS